MRFSQIPPWLAKKGMCFTRKQTLHSIESSKSSHVMGDRENKLGLCPSFFREAACVGSVLSPVALRLVSISQLIETAGHKKKTVGNKANNQQL